MDSAESLLTSTDEDISDDDEDPDEASTVHPRLSCSIKPDSDDIQQNEENDLDISFELDGQHYKTYKSWGVLQELHLLGLPLSFVIANINNESCIGFVLGSGKNGQLVPLHIGRVRETSQIGFTYFETNINEDVESWIPLYSCSTDGSKTEYHSVVNYGHLLPHLSSLEEKNGTSILPYAVVTTDASHMNASYQFV